MKEGITYWALLRAVAFTDWVEVYEGKAEGRTTKLNTEE